MVRYSFPYFQNLVSLPYKHSNRDKLSLVLELFPGSKVGFVNKINLIRKAQNIMFCTTYLVQY